MGNNKKDFDPSGSSPLCFRIWKMLPSTATQRNQIRRVRRRKRRRRGRGKRKRSPKRRSHT